MRLRVLEGQRVTPRLVLAMEAEQREYRRARRRWAYRVVREALIVGAAVAVLLHYVFGG